MAAVPVSPATTAVADKPVPGPVETETLASLEKAHRVRSVAGAIALRLARDLDGSSLTGSQASSVGAQLLRTMELALDGAPAEPDEVDEFSARLQKKRASA